MTHAGFPQASSEMMALLQWVRRLSPSHFFVKWNVLPLFIKQRVPWKYRWQCDCCDDEQSAAHINNDMVAWGSQLWCQFEDTHTWFWFRIFSRVCWLPHAGTNCISKMDWYFDKVRQRTCRGRKKGEYVVLGKVIQSQDKKGQEIWVGVVIFVTLATRENRLFQSTHRHF